MKYALLCLLPLLTACVPKGCRREPGMFGVFGAKYWSGYTCPPTEKP